MPVRSNVFGSRAERDNYFKLSRQWSDRYRVYHNLPFLNVIEVKEGETLYKMWDWSFGEFTVDRIELGRLKKTSVDYVLCDENDQPLLAIDFDGMYQGYSRGRTYVSTTEPIYDARPNKLSWRAALFELKLRVSHAHFFPYVVVASREFKNLSPKLQLTVIDGVIGEVLASRASHEQISGQEFRPEFVGLTPDEWEEMEPEGQSLFIENWRIEVEVETELEHNPVSRTLAELEKDLGYPGGSIRPLEDRWTASLSPSERRQKWWDRPMIGAECTISVDGSDSITRRFWLTNFGIPGFTGISLAENIARLMVLSAYQKQRRASAS